MDFALTQEQEMIVDTTRQFTERELIPHEEKVESTQQQNETVHHVETNPNNNTVENSVETKKENGAHIETVQNEKTDAENRINVYSPLTRLVINCEEENYFMK